MDPISVVFPVSQDILSSLARTVRERGNATVEVRDRNGGALLATGRITALDNEFDVETGTADVRAQFRNPDEALTPGAFVSMRVKTGETLGAIVLPATTVRPGINGLFVYRVREGVVRRVPVKIGYRNDEWAVILSGLAAGDKIVSDGYSQIKDGSRVTVVGRKASSFSAPVGSQ